MSVKSGWTGEQVTKFASELRKRVGVAWNWMVPDIRRALVAEHALGIVLLQDKKQVDVADVQSLYSRMLEKMGLETEG